LQFFHFANNSQLIPAPNLNANTTAKIKYSMLAGKCICYGAVIVPLPGRRQSRLFAASPRYAAGFLLPSGSRWVGVTHMNNDEI